MIYKPTLSKNAMGKFNENINKGYGNKRRSS